MLVVVFRSRYATNMRFLLLITSLIWLVPAATAQEVYRWVDESGVVHYSDQPPAQADKPAEVVDIQANKGFSAPNSSNVRPVSRRSRSRNDDAAASSDTPTAYQQVIINRPSEQQTLWNIATRLPVEVTVIPELAAAHQIQLILDDEKIGQPLDGTRTVLQPVYRGEHSLVATILDGDGNILFRSPPTVFYIQQATLGTP